MERSVVFPHNIFEAGETDFSRLALDLFHFQYQHNPVYKEYLKLLGLDPRQVLKTNQIPFLPISLFKTRDIQSTEFTPEYIFESSGTTQMVNSRHLIKDLSLYRKDFLLGFEHFYGDIREWCIIGLLPSYLERSGSSLVMMVDELIRQSGRSQSGFYLYEYEKLRDTLLELETLGQKTLLIGVTFALLDFAMAYPMTLRHTLVMETGGMKGRRKEMTREAIHGILQQQLGLESIHSEYGMTELLSQAYSKGDGIFHPVPWMKLLVRNEDDPLEVSENGQGILQVIDLGNIYSSAFIATDDVGLVHPDGSFEVLGRMDNSDIRGCSLLVV